MDHKFPVKLTPHQAAELIYIIEEKLKTSTNDVLMLIRDVEPDEKNPWTANQVKEMLDFVFLNNPRVSTLIVPDVASVEYGRGVGYEVNEIKVERNIAGISGTEIRAELLLNKTGWYELVPERTRLYLNDNK